MVDHSLWKVEVVPWNRIAERVATFTVTRAIILSRNWIYDLESIRDALYGANLKKP